MLSAQQGRHQDGVSFQKGIPMCPRAPSKCHICVPMWCAHACPTWAGSPSSPQGSLVRSEAEGHPTPCFQTAPLSAPALLPLPSVCPSPPPPSVGAAADDEIWLATPSSSDSCRPGRGLSRWSLKSERSQLLLPGTSPRPLPLPAHAKPEN